MPNIYDVAKEAKVSVATVSAVVNDSAYVSPHLKARVTAAVKRLGYQPNLLARSLAKQRSHMLGMIVPDIANPFWPDVVRGAENVARAAGYTLLVASSDDEPAKEDVYLRLFLAKRVDGILLTKAPGRLAEPVLQHLARTRTPVVQVSRLVDDTPGDAVLMDDRDAAYESVSHLLRLGFRRIAMISGLHGVTPSERRLLGYRQALRAFKRPYDKALVYEGDYRPGSGYDAGIALLKRKPDAVFVANSQMAVGFMKALQQYQLRCPQDVALVTCDDHEWMDAFHPRLTTVNFPKHEIGATAVRVLVARIDERDRPFETHTLKSRLTIRESCGYPQRARAQQAQVHP
ncbi:MAG: LacI family DNA-binding transcriptional regulator [Vicinamibacterales bacterium]